MWSQLYRDHVIMAFPSFDTATNSWIPQADVTWCVESARAFEFLRFPHRCKTEADAVTCALRKAQHWIDQRLIRLRSGTRLEPGRLIGIIGASKETTQPIGSAQSPRPPATTRHAEEILTYDQFKSRLRRSGLRVSEQQLLKSYVALVKLRDHQHWSWAETIRKVENSHQELKSGRSPARRTKTARIPLTERDWRRI